LPLLSLGAPRVRHSSQGSPARAARIRVALLASLLAITLVPAQAPTAPVAAATTEAYRVVSHAKSHIGAPWRYGAIGPYSFDCSGFVYHSFYGVGLSSRIGGRRSAASYYSYFRSLGRTSRSYPRVGDLVVYGYSGYVSHIGIYIGNGYTISTLTSGVRVHGTFAVTKPFIAYLRVNLSR
jgi:cell wall-associated NlpC family hydrolase